MSRLAVTAEKKGEKTVITDSFFTSPLKIAKPFYKKNHTEIMMMTASAGILDGDYYDIEINLKENTALKLSGQSYTKLFKVTDKGASQNVKITAADGAAFLYMPMPIIPFEDSIFKNKTEVYISSKSKFAMLDVISCGRKAMNEEFKFKSYRSRTAIYIDGKLAFLDNQKLIPSQADLSGVGFFENYSHTGLFYLYGFDIQKLPSYERVEAAITQAQYGKCVRIAADSADEIIRFVNILNKNFFD